MIYRQRRAGRTLGPVTPPSRSYPESTSTSSTTIKPEPVDQDPSNVTNSGIPLAKRIDADDDVGKGNDDASQSSLNTPCHRLPPSCPASLIPKVGLGLRLVATSPFRLIQSITRSLIRWLKVRNVLLPWIWPFSPNRKSPEDADIYIPLELLPQYPLVSEPLSNLWTSSHLTYDQSSGKWKDTYRAYGASNGGRISRRYLAICLKIQQLTFWRTLKVMCQGKEWLMILDFGINVSRGLSEPASLWLFEMLVNEAHKGFEGRVDKSRLLWLAGALAGLEVVDSLILRLQTYINKLQKAHSRLAIDAELIKVDFSLAASARMNPWTQDIMYSAKDLAFDRTFIHNIDPLIREVIGLGGQTYLLYKIVRSLSKVLPIQIACLMVVAPSAISTMAHWSFNANQPIWTVNKGNSEIDYIRSLPDIVGDEFSLYGLRDWALEEWKRLSSRAVENGSENDAAQPPLLISSVFAIIDSTSRSAGYILPALASTIATGAIPFGLAFSASNGGYRIITQLQSIRRTTQQILQATTTQAAFWAAIDAAKDDRWNKTEGWYWIGRQDSEMVDFEDVRNPSGGLKIEIKGLEFTFPGATQPTLHDINLSLEPGETLAIVGVNGGGKSTLAKVIIGMLDYQKGTYMINDISTQRIELQSFHSRVACLLQDFFTYPFSLKKNVGFGDVTRLDDRMGMKDAIKQGGAEEILKKVGWHCRFDPYSDLPSDSEGSDSDLEDEDIRPDTKDLRLEGENDEQSDEETVARRPSNYFWPGTITKLPEILPPGRTRKRRLRTQIEPSGGQWQRIALARTFFRSQRSDLIVYDEPSASLDPRAEHELFKRIRALSKQRKTTIYISHRFSTVRQADKIAVMEGGTIIELGSHQDLMSKKGTYHEMFTLQKEGFDGQ